MQYNTNVKYATLCGRRPYTSTIMLAFYRHMCDRVLIAWRGVRYGVLLNIIIYQSGSISVRMRILPESRLSEPVMQI